MTARTWLGGRNNNQVSNPKNWSPVGKPQPGDTLTATHGTVNIYGNQLPSTVELAVGGTTRVNIKNGEDDHLLVSGTAHINLTNSHGIVIHNGVGNVTVTTYGANQLSLSTPGRGSGGSVTIENHGALSGAVGGFGSNYTINGGTFANGASSAGLDGQTTLINADVIGPGTWFVSSYHSRGPGHLEFVQSVSAEQTVTLGSGVGYSHLQIDRPELFHAAVVMQDQSVIDLNGLAADSYAYRPDAGVLDFYAGSNVIDSLRFTKGTPDTLGVAAGTSRGGNGVEVYSHASPGFPELPHGIDLPVHV